MGRAAPKRAEAVMKHRIQQSRARATADDPKAEFDRSAALAKWKQKLGTMTGRGFTEPPFASLIARPSPANPSHDDPPKIS